MSNRQHKPRRTRKPKARTFQEYEATMTAGERRLLGLPPLPPRKRTVPVSVPGGTPTLPGSPYLDLSGVKYENGAGIHLYVVTSSVQNLEGGILRVHSDSHPHQPRGFA